MTDYYKIIEDVENERLSTKEWIGLNCRDEPSVRNGGRCLPSWSMMEDGPRSCSQWRFEVSFTRAGSGDPVAVTLNGKALGYVVPAL